MLTAYDAVFALGGKSLITLLYTEGSAVPAGCGLFHLSADARNLGRTYATKLAVVGDIKTSLAALPPLLAPRLADREEAYAALREPRGASKRPGARASPPRPMLRSMRRSPARLSPLARSPAPSVPRSRSSTKPLPPRCTCVAF
jgi:thiamine pyrophosphate-dependent acetolactate synthase large subunit-like protein